MDDEQRAEFVNRAGDYLTGLYQDDEDFQLGMVEAWLDFRDEIGDEPELFSRIISILARTVAKSSPLPDGDRAED